MAYKIELLPTAWEDLKHIEDLHFVQFGVEKALKISNNILDALKQLEIFPDSGSLTPDEWLNQKEYRIVICDKHVAIYKQIQNIIYVYHIADTQTEYTKLLK